MAQKIICFCDKGVFKSSCTMYHLHARLLGASVSASAKIKPMTNQWPAKRNEHFVEGDLLIIEDGAVMNGFGAQRAMLDGNYLVLAPVVVKANASVG